LPALEIAFMFRTSLVVAGLLGSLLAADMADAQIFGRRWQRRKAEIKGELSHQLSAQVNADVRREMDVATNKINAATQQTLLAESAQLKEQIAAEVTRLQEQATQLVAA